MHLFERDCTIQRKYQKIIEIAPANFLDPMIREAILNSALTLARRARYGTPTSSSIASEANYTENAGTVEFLVQEDKFYFIEMNPRM